VTDAFGPRATKALVLVAVLSLAVSLVFMAEGEGGGSVSSADADAFSASAVGHRGFVRLLTATGVPVTVSRHASGRRSAHATLLVIEPRPDRARGGDATREGLADMIDAAARSFLVLPKRRAVEDPDVPGRVVDAPLLSTSDPREVAEAAGLEGEIVRPAETTGWTGEIPGAPVLPGPQLLRSDAVEPLLACDQGILVGAYDGGIVLADPDLLANHGLGRGENARIALAAVDLAREGTRPVVVDETLHGHHATPGVWRELFRFPLVLVLLHALLAIAVVLWAAMGRFGAPVPAPVVLEPGKGLLVANTATLLRLGRHGALALDRYWRSTLQTVARAVHAPPGLGRAALEDWLAQVGRSRGADDGPATLEAVRREAMADPRDTARAVEAALRIHRWRETMLGGRA
jgi:hypothetical protein